MATFVNLRDLLEHEVEDLYSAEEQLIEALPMMAEASTNRELKKSIKEHLRVTKAQKKRLDQIKKILKRENKGKAESNFLERMFGGGTKCKGMEGLIKEGNKMMSEDMEDSVKDAAIISASQKIEHYEISGYGAARAYAKQLGLREVERLLATTLKEEHLADKLLNTLALSKVNIDAEKVNKPSAGRSGGANRNSKKGGATKTPTKRATKKSATGKTAPRKSPTGKTAGKKAARKRS